MWGCPPQVFLKFEFTDDQSTNFGAMGSKFPIPIQKPYRLYEFVATAQAVICQPAFISLLKHTDLVYCHVNNNIQ